MTRRSFSLRTRAKQVEQKMSRSGKKTGYIKRILLITVLVIVAGLLLMVGVNYYVGLSANPYIETDHSKLPQKTDAIIVLGAGLDADGRPGTVLKDRIDTAIMLYNEGVSKKLLMSGDGTEEYHNEAQAMRDYAIEKGVPEDDIYMDPAGLSTYESMYRAAEIYMITSCVIVTQTYHLYRSVFLARGLGLNAFGYASEIHIDQLKYLPLEFREFFARIKACFSIIFKPEPSIMGEKTPITG